MTTVRAASTAALVAGAWVVALAPLPVPLRAVAAFFAVVVAPGLLLDLALDAASSATMAERPARALALSVGLTGLAGAACSLLELPIAAVTAALAAVTVASGLVSARRSADASRVARSRPREQEARLPQRASRPAFAAWGVAVLTAAATALAAAGANIARDRMWYAAYVTQLASGDAVAWNEPFLASGRVVWRFAHNAWLVSLGAWSAVADVAAPVLLERVAPPLLIAFAASAAFALARALFRDRANAALVALATMVVLLASRFPYFSPERTAFFARIVEDKTIALVVLAPTALAMCIDAIAAGRRLPRREWAAITLALFAAASTHALVYFLACITLAAFVLARLPSLRAAAWGRPVAILTLAALVAVAPATLGARARSDMLAAERDVAASPEAATDPVVRAHLRMQRLRPLARGGPIVEPALLADPVLLAALAGLVPAIAAVRTAPGAFATAATTVFLALAFLPFVAPAFGRVVVPWMAYRALWGVPFGLLLALMTVAASAPRWSRRQTLSAPRASDADAACVRPVRRRVSFAAEPSRRAAAAAIVVLTAVGLFGLPWGRLRALGASAERLQPDAATRALLERVRTLDDDAIVAAAPGLAELVPAYAGRAVLALADRPTVVFAGSRERAEERLRASALLVAMPHASRELRHAVAARHRVTHVVRAQHGCAGGERPTFSVDRYSVCEVEIEKSAAGRPSAAGVLATSDSAGRADAGAAHGELLARLGDGVTCRPATDASRGSYRWRRAGRWSAAYVSVECTAGFSPAARVSSVVVEADLPRAREALVVRVEALDARGRVCALQEGAVKLGGGTPARVRAGCPQTAEIRVQLVPAYLPYLNLKTLEVRGERAALNAP